MNFEILGKNIRRLRNASGLSQNSLAEASGISLPTIKLIETGKASPRMNTIQAIAEALKAKLQDLFIPIRELHTVRFRSNRQMQNRENILANVARWLDDFNSLEEITGERTMFKLKDIRSQDSVKQIIKVAEHCRKLLGLRNDEPVRDICGLLESAGVKVFPIAMASDGFFGLSIGEEDKGPAVIVNSWERIPTERKIFSAAHELGHLILHKDAFDVTKCEENIEEEKQADLFAGYFLMPDEGFKKEWNETSGLNKVDRILKVKRIFHVSYKTILVRLIQQYGADDSIWQQFHIAYQQRFHRKLAFKEEPEECSPEPAGLQKWDFYEDRLSRLVRKALEMDKISLSRGAEILGISIEEVQDLLRNWETVS
jgi:Zn-dependent peptidase ImmA (M78 family)/DNA-binding XRE family transcriptional regulator